MGMKGHPFTGEGMEAESKKETGSRGHSASLADPGVDPGLQAQPSPTLHASTRQAGYPSSALFQFPIPYWP